MISRRSLLIKGAVSTTTVLTCGTLPSGHGPLAQTPQSGPMPLRSPASPLEYEMYSDLMSTPEMREVFSERGTLEQWLKAWVAMAEAQAEHGIVPKEAAAKIGEVARSLTLVPSELAGDTRKVGRGIAPALRRLGSAVGKDLANYVHVGSTTQDIMDTGLSLQMKQGSTYWRKIRAA